MRDAVPDTLAAWADSSDANDDIDHRNESNYLHHAEYAIEDSPVTDTMISNTECVASDNIDDAYLDTIGGSQQNPNLRRSLSNGRKAFNLSVVKELTCTYLPPYCGRSRPDPSGSLGCPRKLLPRLE